MPPTTFSENQVKNNVQVPEFTICPYVGNKTYGYPKSELESFEDILLELQNVWNRYNVWIGEGQTPR